MTITFALQSQPAPITLRARGPQPQYHVTEVASHVRATPGHVIPSQDHVIPSQGHVISNQGHLIPSQGHVTPHVANHLAGNQSMAPNAQQPNTLTISTECGCSLRVHGKHRMFLHVSSNGEFEYFIS